MVISQQHNQLSQSQSGSYSNPRVKGRLTRSASFTSAGSSSSHALLSGGISPRTPLSLVPVPYRNSKLTHLLKDSLGGNSKTIMIATIRTHEEYYQQTAVTLMYASRAKKIRNRSLVNRNVIGDTGIHAVTHEIERLKTRLQDRSVEFEHLRNTQLKDANENNALKARFQHLKDTNEEERKQLEIQMSQIIYNQAGQQVLREDLEVSQGKMREQQREISMLKSFLEQTKLTLSTQEQLPVEQMERMQSVLDGWQAQAMSTQQELETVLRQAESLRVSNEALSSEVKDMKCNMCEGEKQFKISNEELREKLAQNKEYFSDLSQEKDQLQHLLDASHIETEGTRVQSLESLQRAEGKIRDLESDKATILLKLETTIGTLERQTSTTIENATIRLQKKDLDLAAAHDQILSLKDNLVIEKSNRSGLKDEMEAVAADNLLTVNQLTSDLFSEKQEKALVSARCDQLDSTCKAQGISIHEKDLLLKKSEEYLREIDGDRLKELEKLSVTVMALRGDHKAELDSLKRELGSVKDHIDSQAAIHKASLDNTQRELWGQHEELIKDIEFSHIAESERRLQDLRDELVAAHAVQMEREREREASLLLGVRKQHETALSEFQILCDLQRKEAMDAKEQVSALYSYYHCDIVRYRC